MVPADGFYEWKRSASSPLPWLFEPSKPGALFFIAGIWDQWIAPNAHAMESFAVITTEPNSVVAPFHERMPCIISSDEIEAWLDPHTPVQRLQYMLRPYPAEQLVCRPVHPRLNDVRIDNPSCLDAPPSTQGTGQLELGID